MLESTWTQSLYQTETEKTKVIERYQNEEYRIR